MSGELSYDQDVPNASVQIIAGKVQVRMHQKNYKTKIKKNKRVNGTADAPLTLTNTQAEALRFRNKLSL